MWRGLKHSLGHCRKVRDRRRTRISGLCSRSRAGSCRRVASGAEAHFLVGFHGGAEAPPLRLWHSLAGFLVVPQKEEPCPRAAGPSAAPPPPRLRHSLAGFWVVPKKADPCLRQAGLSASRARQNAAGRKKRETPFGMTR